MSRRCAVIVMLCAALLMHPLAQAAEKPEKEPVTRLTGRVFTADGKSALSGATVHAYHLSTETHLRSEPTGGKGTFLFEDVPFGYYDIAVETPDGVFVSNQVVNVPPAGKAIVNFVVKTFDQGAVRGQGRRFPGSDRDPSGVAMAREKLTGRDFWRSPKGVAIVVGIGAAALIGLAGDSDNPFASPSDP